MFTTKLNYSSKICKPSFYFSFYKISFILVVLFFYAVIVLWNQNEISYAPDILPFKGLPEYKSNITFESKYPIIVRWTGPLAYKTVVCSKKVRCEVTDIRVRTENVDAYTFYGPMINYEDLPVPRRYEVTWALINNESPNYVMELMHEDGLRLFNISATFSRNSDFPMPLQLAGSLESITSTKYFVNTSVKNVHLKKIAPILYLQTRCETSTDRDQYVEKLMQFIEVDSYGACVKNNQLPPELSEGYDLNLNNPKFLRFSAKYKFIIAIENAICDDYVTEKLWRPIKIGSVPIYFGSPTVRDWLPNEKSAILIENYPTPRLLSRYINKLLQDDSLYEQYLEHKLKGVITNQRLIEEFKARPYQTDSLLTGKKFDCFICQKIMKMKKAPDFNMVTKRHLNCSMARSVYTMKENRWNPWWGRWEGARVNVDSAYRAIEKSQSQLL